MSDKSHPPVLEEFKTKIIGHPLLTATRDVALDLIREPAGKQLALIMGPTGVGKTTLFNRLKQHLVEEDFAADMVENKGAIPVVSVRTRAPESGSFDWRDFYIRILKEMHDPAAELDLALSTGGKVSKVSQLSTLNLMSLREMVENAFHHRSVRVLLVDEAQHFQKMASGRRLCDQMDTLKSLAELRDVFIVLVGTYELIQMRELNGQLTRRCASLHFPRYRYDEPGELAQFKNAVHSLGVRLQRNGEEHRLGDHVDMLYKGSCGCFGVLKNWLTRALKLAEGEDKRIGEAELERTMEPTSALLKLAREIKEGEAHWQRSLAHDPELDELLGMTVQPAVSRPPKKAPFYGVGVRNPVRDPIDPEAALV